MDMRRFTKGMNRIIDFIGLHGAMPVLEARTEEPAIVRPGDDETAYRRVGWPEFFKACEKRGYVFVYDDAPGSFDYAFMREARALKETGGRSHGMRHLIESLKGLPVVRHA